MNSILKKKEGSSIKNKRTVTDERKTLVPTRKCEKKDHEGKALLKLSEAMINKYKVQEKNISIEEQHMSLKFRFETMQYHQTLKNLIVSDAEIN